MQNPKATPRKWIVTVLVLVIILQSLFTLILLFPSPLLRFFDLTILDREKAGELLAMAERLPSHGNITFQASFTENDLKLLLEEQTVLEDPLVLFHGDGTMDVIFETADVSSVFQESALLAFLMQVLDGKSISMNLEVSHVQGNMLDIRVNRAFVNRLSIPRPLFQPVTIRLSREIESMLNEIEGFSLTSVSIQEGNILLEGVISR
ncbi:MAG: hypothetical protein R6W96_07740 [Clostridia bacterium]